MKKFIMSTVIIIALISLTACGQEKNNETSNDSKKDNTNEVVEEVTPEANTTEMVDKLVKDGKTAAKKASKDDTAIALEYIKTHINIQQLSPYPFSHKYLLIRRRAGLVSGFADIIDDGFHLQRRQYPLTFPPPNCFQRLRKRWIHIHPCREPFRSRFGCQIRCVQDGQFLPSVSSDYEIFI